MWCQNFNIYNYHSSSNSWTDMNMFPCGIINIFCKMHCMQDPCIWMDTASSISNKKLLLFLLYYKCSILPMSSHTLATYMPWLFCSYCVVWCFSSHIGMPLLLFFVCLKHFSWCNVIHIVWSKCLFCMRVLISPNYVKGT